MTSPKTQHRLSKEERARKGRMSRLTGGLGEMLVSALFLRWGWLPAAIPSFIDQGADFFVEIARDGQGTGFHFLVSSKATESSRRIVGTHVSRTIKEHSADYVSRQRMPVFLLHVQDKHKRAYWLDLKTAIRSESRTASRGFAARIPISQMVALDPADETLDRDRQSFLDALSASDPAVPSLKPPQIVSSIRDHEASLSAIEKGRNVKMTVSAEKTTYHIHSDEPILFTARVQMPSIEDAQKLAETLGYGTSNTIEMEKLEFGGSALLSHLVPSPLKGKMTLSATSAATMNALIAAAPTTKNASPTKIRFIGQITRGNTGTEAIVGNDQSPITIRFRMARDGTGGVTLLLGVDKWQPKSLGSMLGLTKIATFLEQIADAEGLSVTFFRDHQSQKIEKLSFKDPNHMLRRTAKHLRCLEVLREICLRYGKIINLSDAHLWSQQESVDWKNGLQLLDGNTVEIDVPSFTIDLHPSSDLSDTIPQNGLIQMVLAKTSFAVTAFGHEICDIPVDIFASQYAIELSSTENPRMTARLTRQSGGAMFMRRASDLPFDDPRVLAV